MEVDFYPRKVIVKVLEIGPRKVVVKGSGKLVQEKGEHKKTKEKQRV